MLGNEEYCCWEVGKRERVVLEKAILLRNPEKLCWLIDECENWWIRNFFLHKQFQCTQLIFQRHLHCRRRCLIVVINRNDSVCLCWERLKSVNFNLKLPRRSAQLTCSVCHHFSFLIHIFFLIYNIDVFYCYFMMIVNVQSPTLCFLLVQYIDFEWNWIYIKAMAHIVSMCVTYKKQNTFRLKRHD